MRLRILLIIGVVGFLKSGFCQPANDNCVNAANLCPNDTVSATNISSTAECGGADGDCSSIGTWGQCYDVDNSVWFTFITNNNGGNAVATISNISCLAQPGVDELQGVMLQVATPCNPATYTTIDCNTGDPSGFSLSGTGLAPNTTYWIQIDAGSSPNIAECDFDIVVSGAGVSWIVNAAVNNISCNGANDGNISVTPLAGTSPYTYLWDPTGQTTSFIDGLSPGNYTVTITDSEGCDTTQTYTINEPSPISAPTFSNDATCGASDGSALVSASGGAGNFTYSWSDPSNQPTAMATGLASGIYTVTVTDDNGCTAISTAIVDDDTGPSITTASSSVTCAGGADGTASVNTSGGVSPYSFLWSDPASQTSTTATGLTAGSYIIEVTDANNCKSSKIVNVSEPSPLQITVTTVDDQCNSFNGSATATASGGTSPYFFLWNTGQNTVTISGLSSDSYTVTITDENNCTTTSSAFVGNTTGLTVSLNTSDVTCNNGSDGSATANPQSGSSPYAYSWSDGQAGANATGLSAGNYAVTVTDNLGCDTIMNFSITEPPAIELSFSTTDATCGVNDGSATVSVTSGGSSPFSFAWSNGQNGATASSLGAGNYTVTATDNNGCTNTGIATISETGSPTVNIIHSDLDCHGENTGFASAQASGGITPYSFTWSTGQNSQNITGLGAGTYIVTVTDNGGSGCRAVESVTINQPEPWFVSKNSTPETCAGSDGSASITNVSGNNSGYTYSWENGQSGPTATGLAEGSYNVTISDNLTCDTVVTFTISKSPGISTVALQLNDASCGGSDGSVQITSITGGTAPYNFAWSNGQNGPSASNLSAGNYDLTVTDNNTCDTVVDFEISETATITSVDITTTDTECGSNSGTITIDNVSGGNPPYQYSLDSITYQSSNEFTGLPAGTYSVFMKDTGSCPPFKETVVINPPDFPIVETASTAADCEGTGSVTVTVTGGASPYTITMNGTTNGNGSFGSVPPGTYAVTVVDSKNCETTATAQVADDCDEKPLPTMFPAFTPNEDGLNDTWTINHINKYPNSRVYIYNRWGQKVFDSKGYETPWDGRSAGAAVPAGTYYYVIYLDRQDKSAEVLKGSVAIVR